MSSQGAQRAGGCALHDGATVGQGRMMGRRLARAEWQGLVARDAKRTRARGGLSERTQLPASSRTNPSDAESRTNPSPRRQSDELDSHPGPRTNPGVSSSKRTRTWRNPNEPERGGTCGRTCSLAACTNEPERAASELDLQSYFTKEPERRDNPNEPERMAIPDELEHDRNERTRAARKSKGGASAPR
jgi:hypothetical protein